MKQYDKINGQKAHDHKEESMGFCWNNTQLRMG